MLEAEAALAAGEGFAVILHRNGDRIRQFHPEGGQHATQCLQVHILCVQGEQPLIARELLDDLDPQLAHLIKVVAHCLGRTRGSIYFATGADMAFYGADTGPATHEVASQENGLTLLRRALDAPGQHSRPGGQHQLGAVLHRLSFLVEEDVLCARSDVNGQDAAGVALHRIISSGQSSMSTRTLSPAANSPRSSGITASPLACTMELRMPEPWGPVRRA